MRCLLALILIVISFLYSNAQTINTKATDSLISKLHQYPNASKEKADLQLQIANAYYGKDPAKMLQYAEDALQTSIQVSYKIGESSALRYKGITNYLKGDFKTAEQLFEQALSINQSIKSAKGIIACLSNLGSVNMVQNKFPQALQFYQQALKLSLTEKDNLNAGITYGNMGVIYSELKDYDKALEHFKGGMDFHSKINYKIGIANALGNIGNVLFKQKKYIDAKKYYEQALTKNQEIDNKVAIAREYGNIGNTALELKELDKALEAYQKSLQINNAIGNKKGVAVIQQGLANYYLKSNQLEQAIASAQTALKLATDMNLTDVKSEIYNTLSEAYQKQNNFTDAFNSYKKYVAEQNSINNDNNKKQILRLETQYEFDKKEQDYQNKQLLAAAKITQQELEIKNNKLKLSEAEKQKQLETLAFLESQAELEKQQYITADNQKQLTLSKKEKEIQIAKNIELQKEKQLNELQLKNFWTYAIFSIVTLIGLAFLIISRLNIRTLKAKNELNHQKAQQQQQELILKNEIKEAEMQSLRSQMNPHFMFNSINSINNYILKNEKESASKYLTTFAKLMRSILDNSQLPKVSLKKELETLKWYMQLEAARLEHSFDYHINISENTDDEEVTLPPLVLQPFVENAIWHGLNYKPNKGCINIDVYTNEQNHLIIKIKDNGIGRKAAAQFSKQKEHKSYGIDTTISRIKMLNNNNNVTVEDLENNHIAQGTLVTLEFKN